MELPMSSAAKLGVASAIAGGLCLASTLFLGHVVRGYLQYDANKRDAEAQLARLRLQKEDLEKTLSDKESSGKLRLSELERTISQAEADTKDLMAQWEEYRALTNRIAQANTSLTNARQAVTEAETAKNEQTLLVGQAQNDLERLQKEIATAEARLADLKKSQELAKDAEAELSDVQARVEGAKSAEKRAQAARENAEAEQKTQEDALRTLKEQTSALEATVKGQEDMKTKLTEEISSLQSGIVKLQAKATELDDRIAKCEPALEGWTKRLQTARGEYIQATNEVYEAKVEAKLTETERQKVSQEVATLEARKGTLDVEIASEERKLVACKKSVSDLENEIGSLFTRKKTAESELATAKADFKAQKQSIKDNMDEAKKLEATLNSLSEAIATRRKELENLTK